MTSLFAILPALLLACSLLLEGTQGFNDTNIAVNQSLPEGYVPYPDFGVAYKIYDANVSWFRAQELCNVEGAQLAAIDSAQKFEYATREPMGQGVRHVGLVFVDQQWTTLNGDYALPSIPWARNEPSQSTDGQYAMVGWANTFDGLISGKGPNFIGDFICELRLPGSVDLLYEIPQGYVAYRDIGVAYKVYNTPKSWNIARKICGGDGGELAVIDSTPKLDYARHQQKSRNGKMHVGIRRVGGQWVRASTEESLPSTLPLEKVVAEDVRHGFDCATLEIDALVCASCDDVKREFICEVPLRSPVTESPAEITPSTLPSGYIEYPGVEAAYKIHNSPTSWTEARERCIEEGAQLAVTDSVMKIAYATSQANKYATSIWVGIHDPETNNEWVSIIDGSSVSPVPWALGEPSDSAIEACVVWKSSTGLLHATDCDKYVRAYVCELQLSHTER